MKYKKLIMTTFTALTLFGSNSIGYADQLKPFDGIQFSKIDLNNDNLISKTELMNHRKREFSFADTNHDGALSTEELIAIEREQFYEIVRNSSGGNANSLFGGDISD